MSVGCLRFGILQALSSGSLPLVNHRQAVGLRERELFEESLLVHNLSLESRIGEKILVQYNVFTWLIEFVTTVINNIWLARMVVLRLNT